MLCRHIVQLVILFRCAGPHLIFAPEGIIWLVPDLPVFDAVGKAVCPAFVIMADHMLADPGPFGRVFRRMDAVGLDIGLIFDGNTQAEHGLDVILLHCLDQFVGKSKVIGGRIGFVGIKIPEQIGDIHKPVATEGTAHIVKSCVGNVCLGQILHIREIELQKTACKRGLPHAVHLLDRACDLIKIHLNLHCAAFLSKWFVS